MLSYLGHIVSGTGVSVDPAKINAITNWPVPTNVKQLRGFLGLSGHYRRFVRQYTQLAAPLTQLLRKDAFVWTNEAEQAFRSLQNALTHTPTLALPNFSKAFTVETDASGQRVGAVLSQEGRPIAYFSKKLNAHLQSSSTYVREFYAITEAVKRWRQYLLGSHFIILTDHQPLKALLEQTIQTPEQQKWIAKLMGYDFRIQYKPGTLNRPADSLSRVPEEVQYQALHGVLMTSSGLL